MKKTIGLGLLLLTGMTAFAAPAAAAQRFVGRNERKAAVVSHHKRARAHRVARAKYDRFRR
jgi:hypothetical protein